MNAKERSRLTRILRNRLEALEREIQSIQSRLVVLESPEEELEPPRLPLELLLRVADFIETKSRTMVELAMCSRSTYELIAPMMTSAVALKDLVPLSSIDCAAESFKFSRIADLSLETPDLNCTAAILMDGSAETISTLSISVSDIWQLAEYVQQAHRLPNLGRLTIHIRLPIGLFPDVSLSNILPAHGDLQATQLVMTGFYNSPVLNRLVDVCPKLKEITVDGNGRWLKAGESAWAHWDGTKLSNRAVSLISRFCAATWPHLLQLCRRPAFQPRSIEVYDGAWGDFEDVQEAAWRRMAMMPTLETVRVDSLSTERLALGVLGSKSFTVSELYLCLAPARFAAVLRHLRNAGHEAIRLKFQVQQDLELWEGDEDMQREFARERRLEVEFWRRLRDELEGKVSIDLGIRDEAAFWSKWNAMAR